MIAGNGNNILAIDTTITDDLNQSSAYYGFTTNSPSPSSPLDANWNNVDGYTVVVSSAAFGSNGFGSVNIPYVHDSPSKLSSTIKFTPVPQPSTVTNTVTVTATADGTSNAGYRQRYDERQHRARAAPPCKTPPRSACRRRSRRRHALDRLGDAVRREQPDRHDHLLPVRPGRHAQLQ